MEHGGDIDRAIASYGGLPEEWVDLSTGINRMPYPVPALPQTAWRSLPTKADMAALRLAAQTYYRSDASIAVLAGAQSAIQQLPSLSKGRLMRILGPTYNEYANVFTLAGWRVESVTDLADLAGADIAVVVNPNNPTGMLLPPSALLGLRGNVGLLVVDESFMDMTPAQSLAAMAGEDAADLVVLKSFGKFFGLAGLRLGFALSSAATSAQLTAQAGPWPVAGPALDIARQAFADRAWVAQSIDDLERLSTQMDAMVPWSLLGGTTLFRLYDVGDSAEVQHALAQHRIWTRRFDWDHRLLRIGTPAQDEIARLQSAVSAL